MSALKSVQRAIGLLEHNNAALALEALQEAVAALEAEPTGMEALDSFVAYVCGTKPWSGLADFTPNELALAKNMAIVSSRPADRREVPLDNYSHSVVCLVGFDTGEAHLNAALRVRGADIIEQPRAQVLVEVVDLDHERSEQGLPTDAATVVVRHDDGHPYAFEFTLDTPERADAAIAALQGARELAFGPPPPGEVVSRT